MNYVPTELKNLPSASQWGDANCVILGFEGGQLLFSYGVPMACVDYSQRCTMRCAEKLSVTTSKHVNKFCKDRTVKELPLKEWCTYVHTIFND